MKILYAAGLSPNDSSLYRLWALQRLGHQVIPFNAYQYDSPNPLIRKIVFRLSAGPAVNQWDRVATTQLKKKWNKIIRDHLCPLFDVV